LKAPLKKPKLTIDIEDIYSIAC